MVALAIKGVDADADVVICNIRSHVHINKMRISHLDIHIRIIILLTASTRLLRFAIRILSNELFELILLFLTSLGFYYGIF